MKRILTSIAIILLSSLFYSAIAQSSIGVGFALGTQVESAGLQFRGAYDFDAPFRGSADVTHFFSKSGVLSSQSVTTFNLNAQWQIVNKTSHSVYPFIGLNLTRPRSSSSILGANFSSVENHFGWNLGVGSQYEIVPHLAVVGEIKYVLSESNQWVLSLGGVYLF